MWLLLNYQLSVLFRWDQHTISRMDVASIAWTWLLKSIPIMMLHSAIVMDTMLARTPNTPADGSLSGSMIPGTAKKETFAAKSTVACHVLSRMRHASFRVRKSLQLRSPPASLTWFQPRMTWSWPCARSHQRRTRWEPRAVSKERGIEAMI